MKPMTITAVVQCLNEEEFIGDCIRAIVDLVDEVIVIDQASTDGTREILEQFTMNESFRVIHHEGNYLTHGEKFFRDMAIELCKSDWLMLIDADEVMSDGWYSGVQSFLAHHPNEFGMLLVDYWQCIGTTAYHTPDSPLPNERPLMVRKHPDLTSSESMNSTKCHCCYQPSILPKQIGRLPHGIDCFHLGYCKTDLRKRFERNIMREDWSRTEKEKASLLERNTENPLQFLMPCVPRQFSMDRLPSSIRKPKFDVSYDPVTKRILSRTPVSVISI